MGFIVESNGFKWKKDKETGDWYKDKLQIGLHLTDTFEKALNFHKARLPFKCGCCDKNKPKRSRYLGREWDKICIDCAVDWINESQKTFNETIKVLEERKVELAENIDKWKKEMILGALEG